MCVRSEQKFSIPFKKILPGSFYNKNNIDYTEIYLNGLLRTKADKLHAAIKFNLVVSKLLLPPKGSQDRHLVSLGKKENQGPSVRVLIIL